MNNDTMVENIVADINTTTVDLKTFDAQDEVVIVKTVEMVTIDEAEKVYRGEEDRIGIYDIIKRLFDIVLSLCALVVASPIFLIIIILIKVEDLQKQKSARGSVFFTHKRWGHKGKQIKIHKFRSMVCNAEELKELFTPEQKKEFEENFKLQDDPRITKIGNFLRKTSLDELPQLWDILIGHLSVVGPRPIVKGELEKYGVYKTKFLSVKPGLTGYWQVNGRSDTTYDERVELELYYVENKSFWFDIKIILKTFGVVWARRGAK